MNRKPSRQVATGTTCTEAAIGVSGGATRNTYRCYRRYVEEKRLLALYFGVSRFLERINICGTYMQAHASSTDEAASWFAVSTCVGVRIHAQQRTRTIDISLSAGLHRFSTIVRTADG